MTEQLARDIETLAELFKSGGWSEIRLTSGSISLLLSSDRQSPSLDGEETAIAHEGPPIASAAPVEVVAPSSARSASTGTIDPTWTVIAAPNLGTFYRSPKPGAPPFVEVGSRVEAKTEVCLIEVMKLFTSVTAGSPGTIRHIGVADGELVEGGQALIYLERD